jgi:hypothetical protein
MKVTSAVALIQAQAVLPEEVALSLAEMCPNLKLTLDTESRRKALKDGLQEVENREATSAAAQQENQVELKKAGPPKPMNANGKVAKSSERKTPSKAAKRQV